MDKKMERMEELLKDEAKLADIFGGTAEEAFQKLKENGVDLTKEEFDAIIDGMHAGNSDMLTEEELSSVAGGSKKGYNFWYKVGQALDKLSYRIWGNK